MGRKRKTYSEDFKRKMIMEYENGEISAPDFAAKNKISVFTFRKWLESSKKNENLSNDKNPSNEFLKPIDVTKEAKEIIATPKTIETKKINVEINGIILTFSPKNLKAFLEAIQNG